MCLKKIITNRNRLSRKNKVQVKLHNKIKFRPRTRRVIRNRTKVDLFPRNNYIVTGPLPHDLEYPPRGQGHHSPMKSKKCPYCGHILPRDW